MEWSILRSFAYLIGTTTTLLGVGVSTATADAIPAYHVTDLGEGTAQVSTDANGHGIVISPDGGTAYPFTFAPPDPGNPQPSIQEVLSQLPPLTNAPVQGSMTYGDPHNAYSYFLPTLSFVNQNGMFVGTDIVGIYSHIQGAGSIVMASQRQGDGSFGPLTALWSSPENLYTQGHIAEARFLNNQNQVLGLGEAHLGSWTGTVSSFLLSDINSHTLINLQDLLPQWHLDDELGLDDQGRILLLADPGGQMTGSQPHSLLLTPSGLSSDPTTVPEPTALATLVLGLGGLLLGGRPLFPPLCARQK